MQSVQVTYINSGSPKTVTFKNLMIEKCHTFFELNNIHGITNVNNVTAKKESIQTDLYFFNLDKV